jgi:hypothetical protein
MHKVHDRDNNSALNLFNYIKYNAKKIIDKFLSFYKEKNKNNPILKENKQFLKIIGLNIIKNI